MIRGGVAQAQLLFQIDEALRPHFGALLVIGRGSVAAVGVLKEKNVVALRFHARGHLAGVDRGDAIVARGGDEEYGRISLIRAHILVGRIFGNPRARLGIGRIAVLGDP